MSIGIYKITNPNGKIYIGQTVNIEKRFKEYKNIHITLKSQIKIYNSLKKYGPENHEFEIIEECSLDQLNEREIYWGMHFKTLEPKFGLNLRLGKGRGLVSQETKDRIGAKNKKPKPKGFGKKISLLKKGKPNMLNRGTTRSQEVKDKMSQNITGKKSNYKQNSLDFELIKEQYKTLSTNQLSKLYNISVPTMLNYLKNKGIYKFRKNYTKWKKSELKQLIKEEINSILKEGGSPNYQKLADLLNQYKPSMLWIRDDGWVMVGPSSGFLGGDLVNKFKGFGDSMDIKNLIWRGTRNSEEANNEIFKLTNGKYKVEDNTIEKIYD